MAEEYRRQQFSLHYFCEECLSTSMPVTDSGKALDVKTGLTYPDGQIPRLTITALYEEYQEYCRLFNVPVPAEKGQIGKYLKEKYSVSSTVSTESKQSIRYYPGLWIAKSAKLAHAELSLNYSNYSKTTPKLQDDDGKNDISGLLTTATTEKWPQWVIEEIERMFCYIQSCKDPREISYESYQKNAVVSVVAVVSGQKIAIPEKSAVVCPVVSVVVEERQGIEAELQRAEELRREKEEHDREQAAKYTKQPKSYSDMIPLLPKEGSTKEETAIFMAMRGLLARGIGPRIDFLAKDTKLPEATIKEILDRSDRIRKDESSPAGIVVYLPSEASA